ncbi:MULTISPECIES: sodium:proton antiporter [unclassified Leptolyngbya]|uniref:cation:proton antiporter n=1 Tax=unclassified Leptolyngbya TaxID=2650499 RepID=UPI001F556359|nr:MULTISPECIES: sodium:proton antiporter [unclassified Leptolyngbya]
MLDDPGTMNTALAMMLQMIVAVMVGIGAQVIADFFKVPSIVFLLSFGILLGNDGLDIVHPQLLGNGLEVIVALSVALILFEGGLNLELRRLSQVSGSLRNLVTIGTLITLVGGGMAAHWLGEFPWAIAFLFGSLVVVTGPTVISPLLKQVQVQPPVAALLEGESVLIDPVGAILAVVVLDVILNGETDPLSVVGGLFVRLSIGGGIGALGGWALGQGLKLNRSLSDDLKNLVVLAGIWGLFGVAQLIRSEAGLMTAVVAGVVLRASGIPDERPLRRFKGQLTTLSVSVLFVLLAADLSLASLFALGQGALLTVAVLMFIVRPLSIWLCTLNNQELSWRQKLFLAWVAPRGIVSASVASLFAILLTERGVTGGDAIKALVFLTILSTVFLQGLTARWVAQLLGITALGSTGIVIVGCNPLSYLIARLFQERNEAAVLIDTDLQACAIAERQGLMTIASSALDAEVLEQAGLETKGTFLAATTNGAINQVIAQRAAEEFNPPRVLSLLPSDSAANADGAEGSTKIKAAFLPQLPLKNWNRYLSDREIRLGETTLSEANRPRQLKHLRTLIDNGRILPVLLQTDTQLLLVSNLEDGKAGDRLLYLYHDPKPQLIKLLGGGYTRTVLVPETIADIENLPEPVTEPVELPDVKVPVIAQVEERTEGSGQETQG